MFVNLNANRFTIVINHSLLTYGLSRLNGDLLGPYPGYSRVEKPDSLLTHSLMRFWTEVSQYPPSSSIDYKMLLERSLSFTSAEYHSQQRRQIIAATRHFFQPCCLRIDQAIKNECTDSIIQELSCAHETTNYSIAHYFLSQGDGEFVERVVAKDLSLFQTIMMGSPLIADSLLGKVSSQQRRALFSHPHTPTLLLRYNSKLTTHELAQVLLHAATSLEERKALFGTDGDSHLELLEMVDSSHDRDLTTFIDHLVDHFGMEKVVFLVQENAGATNLDAKICLLNTYIKRNLQEASDLYETLWNEDKEAFLSHAIHYPAILKRLISLKREELQAFLTQENSALMGLKERLMALSLLPPSVIRSTVSEALPKLREALHRESLSINNWPTSPLEVFESIFDIDILDLNTQSVSAEEVAIGHRRIPPYILLNLPLILHNLPIPGDIIAAAARLYPDHMVAFLRYCDEREHAVIIPQLPASTFRKWLTSRPEEEWEGWLKYATPYQLDLSDQ